MFKPASTIHEYSLCFSGDPALVLPDEPEERERVLKHARRTGEWQPLIRSGEAPTVFYLKPLTGSQFDWLAGEAARRSLTGGETGVLALRMALQRVDNCGQHKVEHVKQDGIKLVKPEFIDLLYCADPDDPAVGRALVTELGGHVIERAASKLDPL